MIAEPLTRAINPATGEIIERATNSTTAKGALPDELLDRFRQRRGANDPNYWGLGDDIADAVVELAGRGMQTKILKAAALETDLSRAEVRVLFETARACDKSLRDEFMDVLTHSHFRVIRYIDDLAKQQGYLQWCLESADAYGGRPAPAAVLAKKVQQDMGLEPPEPTKGELIERAIRAVEKLRAISEDEKEHDALDRMMTQLERMVNKA